MSKIAILPTQKTLEYFKNKGLRIVHRDPKIASLRIERMRRQQTKPLVA